MLPMKSKSFAFVSTRVWGNKRSYYIVYTKESKGVTIGEEEKEENLGQNT